MHPLARGRQFRQRLRAPRDGYWNQRDAAYINVVLRPALSNLRVTIYDQVAENDKVTSRKTVSGAHTDELLGVAATNREVVFDAVDIVRLRKRRYVEYWGIENLPSVLALMTMKQGNPT